MEDINGALERLVQTLSVSETRDNQILQVLMKVTDQSTGIQNKVIRLLTEHLDEYGKKDIINLHKQCQATVTADDDDIKAYILIGNEVLDQFHIITLKNLKGSNEKPIMMVFKNQSYQRDLSELEEFISNRIIEYNVGHRATFLDVIHYINKQTFFDFRKFNYDPFIMIFKNGVFNFKDNEFITNDKNLYHKFKDKKGINIQYVNNPWQMYYFYEIPHDLDINENKFHCPKFQKALVSWIDEKSGKGYRKGKRRILIKDIFEMMALCMTMNMGMRTAFLNYGEPRCGKTQFFNIMSYLIGSNNISNTSLQRLAKNEFGGDDLPYKVLNYCGDLPSSKISDNGLFKNIVGGDTMVQVEYKNKAKAFFQAVCKFWANANKVPRLGAWDDDATYDRFIMINFMNQFELLGKETIQNFYKTIIQDKNEIQGIIHECIRGYYRLLKRNGFRQILRKDTMHTWNYISNKLYAMTYDDCVKSKKDRIEVNEFWDQYYNKFGTGDGKSFITRRMEELGYRKKATVKPGTRTKIWYYYGLKWTKAVETEIKENQQEDLEGRLTKVREDLDDF